MNEKILSQKATITKKVVLLQPLNPPNPLRGSKDDLVAQQVEHNTFNVGVLGSSPSQVTKKVAAWVATFFFYIYQLSLVIRN